MHYALGISTIRRQGTSGARFELRDGDIPFGGTERTEVQGSLDSGGAEGDTRWYQWSTRIDATFPDDWATQGDFGVLSQWHCEAPTGSPPVSFNCDHIDGNMTLVVSRQSSPGVFLSSEILWSTPFVKGSWHDFKMRIVWSASDATGSIQLWHNGTRVTFTGGPGSGSQTTTTRTLIPTAGATYFKQGIYRSAAITGTAILYHDGFVASTTESGLGNPNEG